MIICITGMPGAGKSLVGKILADKNFIEVEMSKSVKEKMSKEGIAIDKDSIRNFSLRSRKEYGNDVVAKWTMETIKSIGKKDILIVGLRSADEAKYLKKSGTVKIVSVIAPKMLRYERLKDRKRTDDPHNYSDFEDRENKEKQFGIASAMEHADYVIRNTGTLAELREKVHKLLKDIEELEAQGKAEKQE